VTTEKSPRSRFDVLEGAKDQGEAPAKSPAKSLADISHAASLDEETNIPGTDPAPPARGSTGPEEGRQR
jgi:hypothetical protein